MIRLVGDSRRLPDLLVDEGLGHLVGNVACIVGSPPYNVAIPNYPSGYRDHVRWPVYQAWAHRWARAFHEVLCSGGRVWVNVMQTVPRTVGEPGGERVNMARLWANALEAAGLKYRDTVLWIQDSFDGGTAWGSWLQPSAPNLRGSSELILVYCKDRWHRPIPREWKGVRLARGVMLDAGGRPAKDEDGKVIPDPAVLGGPWEDLVRNVWRIPSANPGTWHYKDEDGKVQPPRPNLPALYPIDVPARAIRLSTWPGETVLDPWAGHCTTGFAADALGRESIMVDLGYDEEWQASPMFPWDAPRMVTRRDASRRPPP